MDALQAGERRETEKFGVQGVKVTNNSKDSGFYCRSYCLLNMFRAPLCPSSGAQEYYTAVAACGISCCDFQVVGLVWS